MLDLAKARVLMEANINDGRYTESKGNDLYFTFKLLSNMNSFGNDIKKLGYNMIGINDSTCYVSVSV